uniref:hypothetical protein n=1 Tax=Paracoccus pantotrophus TaxID=82367 RepID=UPI0035B12B87
LGFVQPCQHLGKGQDPAALDRLARLFEIRLGDALADRQKGRQQRQKENGGKPSRAAPVSVREPTGG